MGNMSPRKEVNNATRYQLERDRHLRLIAYAALSFSITMFAYYFLQFDRMRAIAYSICAFVLLNLLNYRFILAKIDVRDRSENEV